ncbi:MAG: type II secretion system F family protein [Nanoarchaeota archaeon]
MKIKRGVIIGAVFGLIAIGMALFFLLSLNSKNTFYFLLGIGVLTIILPFILSSAGQTKEEREKDEKFLEFSRTLVESVSSGTPISKSIINMKNKNFGSLTPHVQKLANQIELGIPIQRALETFAYDTRSKTILRAITLIREADKTGGNINVILESVAKSIAEIEKLKAERRSAISSIVTEGYIIFFIFIVIMVVVEVQILPLTANIAGISSSSGGFEGLNLGGKSSFNPNEFSIAFLSLLIVQGLFAGLIIGKLSEGRIKAGIKHSFIMVALAILISTGSKVFLG